MRLSLRKVTGDSRQWDVVIASQLDVCVFLSSASFRQGKLTSEVLPRCVKAVVKLRTSK